MQVSIKLEANKIQDKETRRSGYGNGNKKHEMGSYEQRLIIELVLVTDEEIPICLQGLSRLHYIFELHSLISFLVFSYI